MHLVRCLSVKLLGEISCLSDLQVRALIKSVIQALTNHESKESSALRKDETLHRCLSDTTWWVLTDLTPEARKKAPVEPVRIRSAVCFWSRNLKVVRLDKTSSEYSWRLQENPTWGSCLSFGSQLLPIIRHKHRSHPWTYWSRFKTKRRAGMTATFDSPNRGRQFNKVRDSLMLTCSKAFYASLEWWELEYQEGFDWNFPQHLFGRDWLACNCKAH